MMDKNYWITEEPIDPADCIGKVTRNEAGAVNTLLALSVSLRKASGHFFSSIRPMSRWLKRSWHKLVRRYRKMGQCRYCYCP